MKKLTEILKNKWAVPAGMLGVFAISFLASFVTDNSIVISVLFVGGMAGLFAAKTLAK